MKTVHISKVFSSEIEDRINASYYDSKFVDLIRHLKTMGKIKDFQLKLLGDMSGRIKKGIFYILKSEYREKGVPFIRVLNIKNFTIDRADLTYISEERNKRENKTCFEPNDIVISKGGTVGKIALIPRWMPKCNISQDLIGISLNKKEKIRPEYVAFFLMSKVGQLQIERIKTRQVQSHLVLEYVRDLKILVPNRHHDEIVNIVESAVRMDADALNKIEKAKKIFMDVVSINTDEEEKYYKIFSSELEDVFTPIFYYPKYLSVLKAVEEKFDTFRLEEIAEISEGDEIGSKNYRTQFNKRINDVPFIRTSDIVNYEIDNYPDYHVSSEIHKKISQDLRPNDILYTKDGKIGLTSLITGFDKCIIASGIAKLRIKEKYKKSIGSYYPFIVLSTEIGLFQALQRTVVAATIPHLKSPERLGEIKIPIIPEDRREEISNLVKEALELKERKKNLIKKAKEITEKTIGQKSH